MRELKFGEQTVRVKATPLALLFYKQEFGGDLLADMTKMAGGLKEEPEQEADISGLDTVAILQLIWAMAKADAFGGPSFPSFINWLGSFEDVDFTDESLLKGALEEAAHGFFRKGLQASTQGRKPRKTR
ncbi:hypothetical protein EV294_101312 [Paenibacillus sp. BK033]|uniref:hypothetical protein n=1 Tax=Paenibacillus sp. BK033 TaxID=2512133 RepID=UPI00105032A2|nr:hypothetical protein [Paenibacillus sp. BK033]TCN00862.1 hypothetical protein EV294_101312 [Paenibacillus sp. BK033]